MKRINLLTTGLVFLVMIFVFTTSCTPDVPPGSKPYKEASDKDKDKDDIDKKMDTRLNSKFLLKLVNDKRKKKGLDPLKLNEQLIKASVDHAQDLLDNYIKGNNPHYGSNGSKVGKRVELAGYKWAAVRENIAIGPKLEKNAFKALWKSKPHKANMLATDVTEIGIGKRGHFWVMVFAKPAKPV